MTHLRARPQTLGHVAATSAALALVLAACGGAGSEPGPSEEASASVSPSASASATASSRSLAVSRTVEFEGREIEVVVDPVVVDGEKAYVRITPDLSGFDSKGFAALEFFRVRTTTPSFGPGASVRLLDLGSDAVYEAGNWRRGSNEGVFVGEFEADDLQPGDTVTVMDATSGFWDVPVVAAGDAGAFDASGVEFDGIEGGWRLGGLVAPISTAGLAWDRSSDSSLEAEGAEVSLSSDVLFAVDSDQLQPEADEVLALAAAQLDLYEGGSVQIVGHTDDVADDAYNQDLSERRAASVHEALGQRTDLGRFEVTVVGKGESEPRVQDTTDEARSANRRVELRVAGTERADGAKVAIADVPLPEATGPVAQGPQGLELDDDGDRFRVSIEQVERRDGYLTGMVEFEALSGSVSPDLVMSETTGVHFSTSLGSILPNNLSVLAGAQKFPPAQYPQPGEGGTEFLTIKMDSRLDAGGKRLYPFVWPDTGQDTITLSNEQAVQTGNVPFRLTDIPVVDAPREDTNQ